MNELDLAADGLCQPAINLPARHLLCTVCRQGGADCPLMSADEAEAVLGRVKADPTVSLRLTSDADRIRHYTAVAPGPLTEDQRLAVFNRKRDLDILQRLGLAPGDTRRARYLYTLLFERVETPVGICAYDTPGWSGCELARSGAYEQVRQQNWQAVVYARSVEEMAEYRRVNVAGIEAAERLFLRPHHLMCMSCWLGRGGSGERGNDTIGELYQKIIDYPNIPVTLVEGPCMACDCCDGFHPPTGRCVHDCGLVRDYKKDLDVFCKLGLFPGDTLPARELVERLYATILDTTEVCGYGDGQVTSHEWSICHGPTGSEGYRVARARGLFEKEQP